MQAFLIALQFLTRLPVPAAGDYSSEQVGRSLAWYPLVGLLIGLLLYVAAWLLHGQAPLLTAAILLLLWVGLTGALHLDGLADSADAWVGGMGDRERTLAIMKDPSSGPMGVAALVLLLLLKFSALASISSDALSPALFLLPVLARSGVALLFVTTPYVRAGGLGEAMSQHAPREFVIGGMLASALLMLLAPGVPGLSTLLVIALLWLVLRHWVMLRLGGFTGDIAGAMLELLECAALLVIALATPHI
jgi:adenosylcobinamide-GDP ribazoletransferase